MGKSELAQRVRNKIRAKSENKKADYQKDDKRMVILDLDQTIISAIPLNELDTVKHPKAFPHYADFENLYRIYARPYLEEFLTKLFKHYRVAVWTAAGISYANFIVKNFIELNGRKLEFVMWSDHCDVSEERYSHPKKLKMLNFYNGKSVIFDDNEDVLEGQVYRAVDSQDFDVTDQEAKDDDFLLTAFDLIKKKLEKL